MTASYTFDVFASLDGFGSYNENGDWGGYWGKEGPEFEAHRRQVYEADQQMVFGANTYREFIEMLGPTAREIDAGDDWIARMRRFPTTVISATLADPLDWPNGHVATGDAAEIVSRLKHESSVPLRSHGSLTLNRALMAAGLVDRVQLTIFPAITGQTGTEPIFAGAADFDLELLECRTFDGRATELTYRPTQH